MIPRAKRERSGIPAAHSLDLGPGIVARAALYKEYFDIGRQIGHPGISPPAPADPHPGPIALYRRLRAPDAAPGGPAERIPLTLTGGVGGLLYPSSVTAVIR